MADPFLDHPAPRERAASLGPRRRAVLALAALAVGLVVSRQWPTPPSTLWFSLAALACAIAAASRGWSCKAALLLTIALLGAGVYDARLNETSPSSLGALLDETRPTILTVDARVLDEPRVIEAAAGFFAGQPTLAFKVRVLALEDPRRRASGVLRVRAPAALRGQIHAGQRLRLKGNALGLRRPLNPGQTDARPLQRQRGVVGSMRVPNARLIERLEDGSPAAIVVATALRLRAAARARAESLLLDSVSTERMDPKRAMLAALVLGQRDATNADQRAAFTRLGLAHLMAISGFHVAVLAGMALVLVRLAGDLGRLEPVILAVVVLAYVAIIPASAPVLRASAMVLVVLVSEASGRRYDRLTVLIWTAFVMLMVRPADLWSMGFQLSFSLVAALMVLAMPVHDAIWGRPIRTDLPVPQRWWHAPIDLGKLSLTTTLICWLIAMPIVIYHTGLVSPLAILTTAVTLPIIMLILALAYTVLIVGIVVAPAGELVGGALGSLSSAVLWLVHTMDAVPGTSVALPRVSIVWTIVAVAMAVCWLRRPRLRELPPWIMAAALALWLGAEVWSRTHLPSRQVLRIDAIAVGDATCMLVRSGGDAILWDCGSSNPNAGRTLIPRAVRALDGWRVRTVVITHPNFDHYSALPDAVDTLGVRTVIVGQRLIDAGSGMLGSPVRDLLDELRAAGVTIRVVGQGDTVSLGSATLTFLSPPDEASWSSNNDHSLVARIVAPVSGGRVTTLLTGDIQREAIARLLDTHPDLHPMILEMPHHGSATDAAAEFVARLDPDIVIQSVSATRANVGRWRHAKAGRRWLTTGIDGCASVIINRDGSVSTVSHHNR
ncbi:MAG: ComEC/Rec2 family competence protein [Planctomycetes bacterium]|nr:ComEC/Rec2 family competence protein [Planctomycetota bacterium]